MDLETVRAKLQEIAAECPWSRWSGLAREALAAMPAPRQCHCGKSYAEHGDDLCRCNTDSAPAEPK